MRSLARVIEVSENASKVTLSSVFSSACINCPSIQFCKNSGKIFIADNPNKLAVSKGDIVKIDLPITVKALRGLIALFIPLIITIIARTVAPSILKATGLPQTEILRFIICLAALLISESAVLVLSLSDFTPGTPIVKQLL